MSYVIQFVLAVIVFLFSTFSAWYEGSELRDTWWEWKYSAMFSNWKHGTVTNVSEISGFDHFIYAAKFKPLFPILMIISLLYILVLLATWLFRNHTNKLSVLFSLLGLTLFLASSLTFRSPTMGLEWFTWLFLLAGMSSSIAAVMLRIKFTSNNQEVY
ncbi:YjdJ family protein [Fictibacillus sp. 5RED26]|uniref:YjdJ family protein n=1 Tax=Fictibacillus sp. 5RED26 TaxID=2745876 RepID=UPI0018CCCC6B|nr:YjdJ family protein [Fictibacillus sp. 5RED26]MBH0157360.1 YjdJ family protein [Fictibacillus sp. 5RED26]